MVNSSQMSQVETLEADVVVVGGGGTGLAAAVTAAENGAKVVLLEKKGLGGNSAIAMGIFAADSIVQKSQNIVALPDDMVQLALEYSHWGIDQRLFRTYVNRSAETVEWLQDKGIKFNAIEVFPGGLRTWHFVEGIGAALVQTLKKNCEDLGVQVLIQTPVKKILTGENGAVTGVLASQKGKDLRVNSKSVIVATGGYGGNKDLLKKYFHSYSENMQNGGLDHLTGDGLLMGQEIGAATEGLGNLMLHPQVYPGSKLYGPKKKFPMIVEDPRALWVNKKGQRFTDEGIALRFHECGNVINTQPDKCSISLWDTELKNTIKKEATGTPVFMSTRSMPEAPLTNLENELLEEAEKGGVKISDSWDGIAKWIGVAPEVLKATVDEYNAVCDQGYDDIFGKHRRYLRALRTPPYYAIKCYMSYLTTLGGLKINHRMEVLNEEHDPIPGLYAGGDASGGWESETYCMDLAGSAFGFAVNSGRMAGENAVAYVRLGAK